VKLTKETAVVLELNSKESLGLCRLLADCCDLHTYAGVAQLFEELQEAIGYESYK